ncbi:MAG: aconitase X [Candidatus Methanofastidiosia archaeon]
MSKNQLTMELTPEEHDILNGSQGETMAKAMKSVVKYGEAFGAENLVEIDANPHLVLSISSSILSPYLAMVDELIAAGIKTKKPFTTDPRPIDHKNVKSSLLQKIAFKVIYGKQAKYEENLLQLGMVNDKAFTCTPYLPEVGNIPKKGDILAWSESSAVVFVNSVLGARTHRNSAGIDLLCNIVGKVPFFGLVTDQGRYATWLVDVKTSTLPNAQLLGSAIGLHVVENTPYITGLDNFLGTGISEAARDYLKDLGAAAATNGAVGLYHVENITPEAVEKQQDLLVNNYQTYTIDDAELERVMHNYPVQWKHADARPQMCFIGCPHLSLQQLHWWVHHIKDSVHELKNSKVKVDTVLCAAPAIVEHFKEHYTTEYEQIKAVGVTLSSLCPLAYMNNPLSSRIAVITNSNKLRGYSSARFFVDESILKIITTGNLPGGVK